MIRSKNTSKFDNKVKIKQRKSRQQRNDPEITRRFYSHIDFFGDMHLGFFFFGNLHLTDYTNRQTNQYSLKCT